MNERIKELLDEASNYAHTQHYLHVKNLKHVTLDQMSKAQDTLQEKFAELLVRECLTVGSQWADGLIDTKHYDFVNKKIKEHFGVEE